MASQCGLSDSLSQLSNLFGLPHCHLRVTVYTGGKLGLAGPHGTDDEDSAVCLGKIEVIDGVMNAKIGKTETLYETLCLFHILDERQNNPSL